LVGFSFARKRSTVQLVVWTGDGTSLDSPFILPAVCVVALVHLVTNKDPNWAETIPQTSMLKRIFAYSALFLLIVCLGETEASPFIYFQF